MLRENSILKSENELLRELEIERLERINLLLFKISENKNGYKPHNL